MQGDMRQVVFADRLRMLGGRWRRLLLAFGAFTAMLLLPWLAETVTPVLWLWPFLDVVLAPVALFVSGAGLSAVVIGAVVLGVTADLARRNRALRWGSIAGATYLALGALWWAGDDQSRDWQVMASLLAFALGLQAMAGPAVPALWTGRAVTAWHSLWAVLLLLALAIATVAARPASWDSPEGLETSRLLLALISQGAIAAALALVASRGRIAGPALRRLALRFAGVTVAAQALLGGLAMLLPGQGFADRLAALGAGPAIGFVAALAWLGFLPRRPLLLAALGAVAAPAAAAWFPGGSAGPGVPPLFGLAFALAAWTAGRARWWRLVALLLAGVLLHQVVPWSEADAALADILHVGLQWALLWPLFRALRPDLVAPGEGIGWKGLLLAPAWLGGVYVAQGSALAGLGFWPAPWLALPVAGWIALRYGQGALPGIAVALAPMVLHWRGQIGPVGLSIGGAPGFVLAALLVALFAADSAFRSACFHASRLRPWHLGALALLPAGYASLQAFGFALRIDLMPLFVVVAVLIGLSQVPLRVPLLTMTAGLAGAVALALLVGMPSGPVLGRLSYGLGGFPGDLLTVLLAFGLFRMLRDPALPSSLEVGAAGRWLLRRARDAPWASAGVVAVLGACVSIALPWERRLPNGLSLLGPPLTLIGLVHLYLLAVFLAASRPAGLRLRIGGLSLVLPWIVLLGGVALLVSTLPAQHFEAGALQLRLFGQTLAGVIGVMLSLWACHCLGLGLAARMAPATASPNMPHPVFATKPLQIGLALAVLSVLALLGTLAAILLSRPVIALLRWSGLGDI